MDMCTHTGHLVKIKRQALRNISSSRATWQNLSAPSSIERTRLQRNDSHPNVSSKPLIQDEAKKSNSYAHLYLYIYMFFNDVNHSRVFRVIELLRHLNT